MRVPRSLALPLALYAVLAAETASAQMLSGSRPNSMPAEHPGADSFDTWAVRLRPGSDPQVAAARAGARNLGQIAKLPDTYLFHVPGGATQHVLTDARLRGVDGIVWQAQQIPHQRYPRAIADPLFPSQWHLVRGALASVDANVQPAWDLGADGTGVIIAVADTGVAHTHGDIAPNYRADLSWDFNGNDANPNDTHGHGTSAAGVAAAADDGVRCGVGAAYNAQIAGLRLIMAAVTDATEAEALGWRTDAIHISSNSWGPSDNGATVEGPGPLTRAAMEQAAEEGRDGRGTIYVWAAGNGGTTDDVGADGYASMRQVIAVAGVTSAGGTPWYGEHGSAILVAAPTDGGSRGVTTTALSNGCTNSFGGTSSAAPLVSGIVALMLDARPELSWRDVQHVLVQSAIKVNAGHAGWFDNAAGLHFNEFYGFGMVDAGAAVELAATWDLVEPALAHESSVRSPNIAIPNAAAGGGATDTIDVETDIASVEHVEVVFNATHQRRGQMEVTLVSPSGTEIRLLRRRSPDTTSGGFSNWKFSANAFWGEDPNGTWTLRVRDALSDSFSGTWQNWQLIVHGTGSPQPEPEGALDAATPFGSVVVGHQSTSQVLALKSMGNAPLQLLSTAALDASAHFTLDPGTCTSGADLGIDGSCSVTVQFVPQAEGEHTTVLRIATNAGEFTADLSGDGIVPAGQLAGDGSFGTWRVGIGAPVRWFTLHSTGSAALVLDGDPQLSDATHFVLEAGTCANALDLGTEGECTVGARYLPNAPGAHATELRIPTNAGVIALTLEGDAIDPGAQISGSVAFANTLVGTVSDVRTVQVISDGTTPLRITAAPVLDDSTQFAIVASDCVAGTALETGEQCGIDLRFAPSVRGAHQTTLHIATNAGTFMLTPNGTGVVPVELFADGFETGID